MTIVQYAIHARGELAVKFFFFLIRPWVRVELHPIVMLSFPLVHHRPGYRVFQSPCDEIRRAFLLPVRQLVARDFCFRVVAEKAHGS